MLIKLVLALLPTLVLALPTVPVIESDLPERKDYRELVTSIVALENQIQKSVEHAMRSQVPGYVRPTYYITNEIDEKTGMKSIKADRRQKWISGRPIPTERPLDFCLNASHKGFFRVQLENGLVGFTKDGRFRIDYLQRLVTVAGNFPVLGKNGIISVGPVDSEEDISVTRTGVLYNKTKKLDQLDIAVFKNFLDLDALTSINGVIFLLNWEVPFDENPESYAVLQYNIEQSNTFSSFDSWFEKGSFEGIANVYYKMIDSDRRMIEAAAP